MNPATSTDLAIPNRALRDHGFTLLEVVVVILIIGVMVTFASLSIGNRINEDKLENEARRMEAVLRLASEEAEAKGIDIGLRFSDGGYRLLVVDQKRHWSDYEAGGPLRRQRFKLPFKLQLKVDGRPVALPAELPPDQEKTKDGLDDDAQLHLDQQQQEARRLIPQVLLLSSGEITPFTLELSAPGIGALYRIESDAFGRIQFNRMAVSAHG